MNEYLLQVIRCVDLLGLVGHEVSEKDHIDVILDGLGVGYDAFVLAIESRLDPYTVDVIESLLLAQEVKIDKHLKWLDST